MAVDSDLKPSSTTLVRDDIDTASGVSIDSLDPSDGSDVNASSPSALTRSFCKLKECQDASAVPEHRSDEQDERRLRLAPCSNLPDEDGELPIGLHASNLRTGEARAVPSDTECLGEPRSEEQDERRLRLAPCSDHPDEDHEVPIGFHASNLGAGEARAVPSDTACLGEPRFDDQRGRCSTAVYGDEPPKDDEAPIEFHASNLKADDEFVPGRVPMSVTIPIEAERAISKESAALSESPDAAAPTGLAEALEQMREAVVTDVAEADDSAPQAQMASPEFPDLPRHMRLSGLFSFTHGRQSRCCVSPFCVAVSASGVLITILVAGMPTWLFTLAGTRM
eukprot:TRINITY_DN1871_c0_g1_i2.p1 TRINITY_DN1871_c0_g1~~TRINITY_DN1871_c0_g1_i2.p1  ORF type:complete len:345 (-),score=41.20 TRINITY_DN1871_c0_g1_i2:107-1117(-)